MHSGRPGEHKRICHSLTPFVTYDYGIIDKNESLPLSHRHGEVAVNGKILVMGGYDGVGRTVSVTLGNRFPGGVIADHALRRIV
jgi:hypothetical protein